MIQPKVKKKEVKTTVKESTSVNKPVKKTEIVYKKPTYEKHNFSLKGLEGQMKSYKNGYDSVKKIRTEDQKISDPWMPLFDYDFNDGKREAKEDKRPVQKIDLNNVSFKNEAIKKISSKMSKFK